MKLEEKEVLVAYAGLTNALIDLMENDFRKSIFNRNTLKYHTKHLLAELLKLTDNIYKDCDDYEVVEQHVEAGEAMMKFFVLGLRMIDMDSVKRQGLNTQLNILLKNYGVEIDF